MRAAVLTAHGARDVVQVIDSLPVPQPGPGEVRLKIKAVALNRLDLWVREGWKGLNLQFPHVTCADGAGIVDALGEGVTSLVVGDRVSVNPTLADPSCYQFAIGQDNLCPDMHILGEGVPGVAADYVVLPARNLLKIPDFITFNQAAAAGLVYLTAWHSLVTRGGLRFGETVLVVGAGGGVNTASIQIAKLAGCTVYVVASSAEKCAQARGIGADVTVNRAETPEWSKELFRLTEKAGVDIVVDNVGASTLFDSIRAVKRGGRILIVGTTSGSEMKLNLNYIFSKQISLIGSTMGTQADYVRVMNKFFETRLQPVIGATLPLSDIREGHRMLEEGAVFGKVVLSLDN